VMIAITAGACRPKTGVQRRRSSALVNSTRVLSTASQGSEAFPCSGSVQNSRDIVLYNNPPPLGVAGARPEHRLVMDYGSCDRGRETSCAPPLAISIWAPFCSGGSPRAPGIPEDEDQRRGLPVSFEEPRYTLYTSSITIDVQGDGDIRERAIAALRTANAQVIGVPEIGPGESLLPLIAQ